MKTPCASTERRKFEELSEKDTSEFQYAVDSARCNAQHFCEENDFEYEGFEFWNMAFKTLESILDCPSDYGIKMNAKPEKSAVCIKTPAMLEAKINNAAKGVTGLTFGYIGNRERWGDDRGLYLWTNDRLPNGNPVNLWRAEAKTLSLAEACMALKLIEAYKAGVAAASA